MKSGILLRSSYSMAKVKDKQADLGPLTKFSSVHVHARDSSFNASYQGSNDCSTLFVFPFVSQKWVDILYSFPWLRVATCNHPVQDAGHVPNYDRGWNCILEKERRRIFC